MKYIFVIVGHTGAGKSSICNWISDNLNYPIISFSEIARQFSTQQGFEHIRDCFNALEINNFITSISKCLLDAIVEKINKSDVLIIDGLYIYCILDILRNNYCTKIVYINVPEQICQERVAHRLNISADLAIHEYKTKESMKEDLGNNIILNYTDFVFDGTQPTNTICTLIIENVFSKMSSDSETCTSFQ